MTDDLHAAIVGAVRDAAREYILPRFRNLRPDDVGTKSGPQDLVTLADTLAERAMTAALAGALPDALIVGEEAIAADPTLRDRIAEAETCVILDPVDGTWNFAKGLPLFGVIAAVTSRGRPVAGMLHDPVVDDWVWTKAGGGAVLERPDGASRPLRVSEATDIGAITGYVPAGLFGAATRIRLVEALQEVPRIHTLRCSCHEYRMLAQGHVEFCLSGPEPHPWDHAAGTLAVREAGGVARMLDGSDYHAGVRRGVILSANSEVVWAEVAERVGFLI